MNEDDDFVDSNSIEEDEIINATLSEEEADREALALMGISGGRRIRRTKAPKKRGGSRRGNESSEDDDDDYEEFEEGKGNGYAAIFKTHKKRRLLEEYNELHPNKRRRFKSKGEERIPVPKFVSKKVDGMIFKKKDENELIDEENVFFSEEIFDKKIIEMMPLYKEKLKNNRGFVSLDSVQVEPPRFHAENEDEGEGEDTGLGLKSNCSKHVKIALRIYDDTVSKFQAPTTEAKSVTEAKKDQSAVSPSLVFQPPRKMKEYNVPLERNGPKRVKMQTYFRPDRFIDNDTASDIQKHQHPNPQRQPAQGGHVPFAFQQQAMKYVKLLMQSQQQQQHLRRQHQHQQQQQQHRQGHGNHPSRLASLNPSLLNRNLQKQGNVPPSMAAAMNLVPNPMSFRPTQPVPMKNIALPHPRSAAQLQRGMFPFQFSIPQMQYSQRGHGGGNPANMTAGAGMQMQQGVNRQHQHQHRQKSMQQQRIPYSLPQMKVQRPTTVKITKPVPVPKQKQKQRPKQKVEMLKPGKTVISQQAVQRKVASGMLSNDPPNRKLQVRKIHSQPHKKLLFTEKSVIQAPEEN